MSGATATMDVGQKEQRKQVGLKDAIVRRTRDSHYRALRYVSVAQEGNVVTLKGQVPSHFLKQVAQSIALDVVGSERVVNDITVSAP